MSGEVSRRGVTRGAAWAVPSIAVAAAAPAVAATVCPGATFLGAIFSDVLDQITVTNAGPVPWPAGTTIVWAIQNVRTPAAPAAFTLPTVSGLTAGTVPTSIARNATATILFTRTTSLAAGASVFWRFALADYRYNSRITVNFAGTTLANCPSRTACISNRFNVIGSTCPTAAAAAARGAAPVGPPDPIVPR